MKRVAVFLDAGYFWVQLCKVILGKYNVRTEVNVDYEALRKLMLSEVEKQFGSDCHFLRVYWYDGPGNNGKTTEHHAIDKLDDFKLRLGTRNGVGTQKGVDGLIIADLISLTQQRAITHAMLMTGDSDITPGVVAAQGMGLRAHLLSLGSSVATSPYLAAEADFKRSWGASEVAQFAKAVKAAAPKAKPVAAPAAKAPAPTPAAAIAQSANKAATPATAKQTEVPAAAPARAAAPAQKADSAPIVVPPTPTDVSAPVPTAIAPAALAEVPSTPKKVPDATALATTTKPAAAAVSQAMIDAFAKAAKEQSLLEPHVSTLPPMPAPDVKLLPREIDIFLLTVARQSVGRSLYEDEKRALRDAFKKLL